MEIKLQKKAVKNPILRVTPSLEVILSIPPDTSQKEIDYILKKKSKMD